MGIWICDGWINSGCCAAVSCIDTEDTEEDEEEEEDYDDDDEYIKEDNDDGKAELACPFCSDDYDILGLCCHIDSEHRVEIKSGVRVLNILDSMSFNFWD